MLAAVGCLSGASLTITNCDYPPPTSRVSTGARLRRARSAKSTLRRIAPCAPQTGCAPSPSPSRRSLSHPLHLSLAHPLTPGEQVERAARERHVGGQVLTRRPPHARASPPHLTASPPPRGVRHRPLRRFNARSSFRGTGLYSQYQSTHLVLFSASGEPRLDLLRSRPFSYAALACTPPCRVVRP